jgi:uncharacterized membrane protein
MALVITLYVLVALGIIGGVAWYTKLTLTFSSYVLLMLIAALWPVVLTFVVVANRDNIANADWDKVKKEVSKTLKIDL